ncbi:hypothetical protein K469DRAFT_704172 [Zopfia rhizophila CBS 207.26]|uniref:Uncharacterized protein n=1 Tax=Zopfia rhizophila CBS 207.26 TaxID=1314779 RepID=A0A6A6EAT1_9PEZI|nr:hypothetical protein K469DRAFT_704172 [Zopfia rhizophila CBS 207.26]
MPFGLPPLGNPGAREPPLGGRRKLTLADAGVDDAAYREFYVSPHAWLSATGQALPPSSNFFSVGLGKLSVTVSVLR